MSRTKQIENFKLMNKLLTRTFEDKNIDIDKNSLTTKVPKDLCTAEVCLCTAIAKRTKANIYTQGNKFVFYQAPVNTAHYLRWADKHIKEVIELEA
jgi:hypothetical protein